MNVDPRITEMARAIQQEHLNRPKPSSVLAPVRVLIAEFIYLGVGPSKMFEFIQRAGIQITYKGMHAWVRRNFGVGADGARSAAEAIQKAVDEGSFTSPYFQPTPTPPDARQCAPAAKISPPRNSTLNSGAPADTATPPASTHEVPTPPEADPASSRPANEPQINPAAARKTAAPTTQYAPPPPVDDAKEAQKQERLALLSASMKKFDSPFKKIRQPEGE